ncbi:MAG TPA: hypothetical protein DCM71_10980 [Runella sp.]|nr:hypothetical protein [Runella sp.]
MYTAIEGIYENGTFTLNEAPPTRQKTKVLITFMRETPAPIDTSKKGVRLGSLEGKIRISDDFNAPINDLKEYM